MITTMQVKDAGRLTSGIEYLVDMHWRENPHFAEYLEWPEWKELTYELIRDNFRAEGLIIDQTGTAVAATIWMPAMDIHYGRVAVPIAHMVDPFWRGTGGVLRDLSKLREQCIRALVCERYLNVQHISPVQQRQTLRTLRGKGTEENHQAIL